MQGGSVHMPGCRSCSAAAGGSGAGMGAAQRAKAATLLGKDEAVGEVLSGEGPGDEQGVVMHAQGRVMVGFAADLHGPELRAGGLGGQVADF